MPIVGIYCDELYPYYVLDVDNDLDELTCEVTDDLLKEYHAVETRWNAMQVKLKKLHKDAMNQEEKKR